MERVSDRITIQEMEKWKANSTIIIDADTGAGKSYWCNNTLHRYAKQLKQKVLMLVPRVSCYKKFTEDKEDDIITIMSYQRLEKILDSNYKKFSLDEYDYIVCDEYHYFSQDSWNRYTELSFNKILESKAIKIMMSATGECLMTYIKNKQIGVKVYSFEHNNKRFNELIRYSNKNDLYNILDSIKESDGKALVCFSSAQRAYEVYERYNSDAMFYCSSSNGRYNKYISEEIDEAIQQEQFDSKFLFTTTALDVGISFYDKDLKYIIIDGIIDIDTIKQFIGRKRFIDENDIYDKLYLFIPNKQSISHRLYLNTEEINRAFYLLDNGSVEYVKKYSREIDKTGIVYDDIETINDKPTTVKKVNMLMLNYKILQYLNLSCIKEVGFRRYFMNKMDLIDVDNSYLVETKDMDTENERRISDMEQYLNSMIGKRLYKEDQSKFIDRLGIKINGRKVKSAKKINAWFVASGLEYVVLTKRDNTRTLKDGSPNPNKDKNYWIIDNGIVE